MVTLLWQAALALQKTHAAGIVHRDLKPENLFLTQRDDGSPRLKILDFGIAKVMAHSPHAGQQTATVGTPLYMAPEQIRGGGVGPPADLYALAQIAYALLVARPYWADSWSGGPVFPLLMEVVAGVREPASERAARAGIELPTAFDAWFAKATALSSSARFASATEMIDSLGNALGVGAPRPHRHVAIELGQLAPAEASGNRSALANSGEIAAALGSASDPGRLPSDPARFDAQRFETGEEPTPLRPRRSEPRATADRSGGLPPHPAAGATADLRGAPGSTPARPVATDEIATAPLVPPATPSSSGALTPIHPGESLPGARAALAIQPTATSDPVTGEPWAGPRRPLTRVVVAAIATGSLLAAMLIALAWPRDDEPPPTAPARAVELPDAPQPLDEPEPQEPPRVEPPPEPIASTSAAAEDEPPAPSAQPSALGPRPFSPPSLRPTGPANPKPRPKSPDPVGTSFY